MQGWRLPDVLVALTFVLLSSSLHADDASSSFLKQYCFDCHSGDQKEGNLDLQTLTSAAVAGTEFERWVRVFDRVHAGEMPPKVAEQPSPVASSSFLKTLGERLRQQQQGEYATLGRVRGRRLTNLQLERTLHDLLGIDIPLARLMPEEPRTNGYTTVASGQSISHFQLQTHLSVVDAALDEAFRRALADKTDEWSRNLSAQQVARENPKRRCREPEMLNGKAVVWNGGVSYYGRVPATTARESGWYRVHVTASALNKPADHGVWCTVRTGACISSEPLLEWAGAFEAVDEPREWTMEAWLPRGHMFEIRPGDSTLKAARFSGGQVGAGEGEPQNVPGVAIHGMRLERIHRGPDNEQIRQWLFGDLEVQHAESGRRRDRESGNVRLNSETPWKDAASLMSTFANRAFRRPVSGEIVKPYVQLVQDDLKNNVPLLQALRNGYRAILCSPRFLHFQEEPGRLDHHAVACRLSYLLWNSMPDEALRQLADTGKLHQTDVLIQQTTRMLQDAGGPRFVKDFAAEWLDLQDIDFTEPDRRLYPGFDVIVQQSMLEETHAYLQTMLNRNLSVAAVMDSDFTFLNSRLARFYGIPDVPDDHVQQVALRPEHHRGGLLTQGSILKVTANGTTTSPVIRGVWISERLLGKEIPPPPQGVPAIEPDIRGATSIREMLEKHKSDTSCAACHVNIDPPGFALENFDPSGRWRTKYGSSGRNKKDKGIAIDVSSDLPDGRHFDSLDQFQQLMLQDKSTLAANVTRQLLTYGTGATCGFSDRDVIEQIVKKSEASDFGFRTLLDYVITSDTFLNK